MSQTAVERFRQMWAVAKTTARLDMLARLTPIEVSAWAGHAPDWLLDERDPLLAAAIVKTFGSEWPTERIEVLVSRVRGESAALRQAALAALALRAPQVLRQELPPLLLGDDVAMRMAAIRGLAMIDGDEAMAHLEVALADANREVRQEGLKLCLVLPFAQVKSMLLRFIAIEAEAEFIEAMTVLFATNPDPEVPFRLWEVAEVAPAAKKQLLKRAINNVCEAIRDAGILPVEFAEYRRRLESWIQKRVGARFVQDVLARLDPAAGIDLAELETAVLQALQRPAMHAAMTEALHQWHLTDEVRRQLAAWLGVPVPPADAPVAGDAGEVGGSTLATEASPAPGQVATATGDAVGEAAAASVASIGVATSASPPADAAPIDPLTASPELCCHWLAGRRPDEGREVRPVLEKLLTDGARPVEVRAAALRTALRLELDRFAAQARSWLRDADERLVSVSLEYLGRYASDEMLTIIGRFLKMPSARIKAAALKVLRRFDTPQAISTLMLMLADQDPEGRAAAMSCLIYFDFALVRLPLTELLQANPQDELLREALCLFASNPDPENLYSLFVLERTMASSAVAKIRTVRQQCEQILIAYGRLDPNGAVQREQDFSGRWQAEQARKAAPPPPYSVKKLRPGAMPVPAVAASESDEGWTGKVASFGRDLLKRLTE